MKPMEKIMENLGTWAATGKPPMKGLTVADYDTIWHMLPELKVGRKVTTISENVKNLLEKCGFLTEEDGIGWAVWTVRKN